MPDPLTTAERAAIRECLLGGLDCMDFCQDCNDKRSQIFSDGGNPSEILCDHRVTPEKIRRLLFDLEAKDARIIALESDLKLALDEREHAESYNSKEEIAAAVAYAVAEKDAEIECLRALLIRVDSQLMDDERDRRDSVLNGFAITRQPHDQKSILWRDIRIAATKPQGDA